MIDSRKDSSPSLPEFLSARARQASDTRLALDVACGFIVATAAAIWRGPAWHLVASGAVCFLAYGAWGIVDRELAERATAANTNLLLFRNVRIAATIVGVIAAVSLVMGTLFVLLGRIQS